MKSILNGISSKLNLGEERIIEFEDRCVCRIYWKTKDKKSGGETKKKHNGSQKNKNLFPHRCMCKNVHYKPCWWIPKPETTQMSFSGWKVKQRSKVPLTQKEVPAALKSLAWARKQICVASEHSDPDRFTCWLFFSSGHCWPTHLYVAFLAMWFPSCWTCPRRHRPILLTGAWGAYDPT